MTHRTFTIDPPSEPDPLSFNIEGTYSKQYMETHPDSPATWSESFTLVGNLPVGVLALYQRAASSSGSGETVWAPAGVISFLAAVIDQNVNEGRARFYALCDDADRLVPLAQLVEILKWAAEELIDRPTGPATT